MKGDWFDLLYIQHKKYSVLSSDPRSFERKRTQALLFFMCRRSVNYHSSTCTNPMPWIWSHVNLPSIVPHNCFKNKWNWNYEDADALLHEAGFFNLMVHYLLNHSWRMARPEERLNEPKIKRKKTLLFLITAVVKNAPSTLRAKTFRSRQLWCAVVWLFANYARIHSLMVVGNRVKFNISLFDAM